MSGYQRGLLSILLSLIAASGCADSAELDEAQSGRRAASDEPASEPSDEDLAQIVCEPSGSGRADAGARPSTPSDAGGPIMRDAGTSAPKPDASSGSTSTPKPNPTTSVAGSAKKANCSSIAKPTDTMCGSYYCGVDESAIESALASDTLCPSVEAICEGRLVGVVGECARSTLLANLGNSFDSLRPKISDCVLKDAQFKEILTTGCLSCFVDAAVCAGNKCLADCLSDSPACDACRQKNNCDQQVFECAKLPNPF